MTFSLRTQVAGPDEMPCCRCGKFAEKSSLWFTEAGWMCDNCFSEYINLSEDAKKRLFEHETNV